jgi:hypothetical protein
VSTGALSGPPSTSLDKLLVCFSFSPLLLEEQKNNKLSVFPFKLLVKLLVFPGMWLVFLQL